MHTLSTQPAGPPAPGPLRRPIRITLPESAAPRASAKPKPGPEETDLALALVLIAERAAAIAGATSATCELEQDPARPRSRPAYPAPSDPDASSLVERSGSVLRIPVGSSGLRRAALCIRGVSKRLSDADHAALVALAEDAELIIGRRDVWDRSKAILRAPSTFIGASAELRHLEREIAVIAASHLPVTIAAEPGTEAALTAFAVHARGPRAHGPYVEVADAADSPEQFSGQIEDAVARARSGTLVIQGMDALGILHARVLGARLRREGLPATHSAASAGADTSVRLIGTMTRWFDDLPEIDGHLRPLVGVFDFLRLKVPPVRLRRGDVPLLLAYFAQLHGGSFAQFTPDAVRMLEAYHWPGNVAEVERVAARLVVTARGQPIGPDRLTGLARVITGPPIWSEAAPRSRTSSDFEARDEGMLATAHTRAQDSPSPPALRMPPAPAKPADSLASRLLRGETDQTLHPSLMRALAWARVHAHEDISSAQISRVACVSASHFAHLCKRLLGMTFRNFLTELRIEKAKNILEADPRRRITEIAMDVGFGDLSHFIKSFKRIVGVSPREYRQRRLNARTMRPLDT